MKKLNERINYFLPLPDARTGHGYSQLSKNSKRGIGQTASMTSTYPYDVNTQLEDDAYDYDDQELGLTPAQAKKLSNKVAASLPATDPFPPKLGGRQAFVNGATRLDLGLSENLSLKSIDSLLEYVDNLGGISPFLQMGNGAGIYKTKSGKTIGGLGWQSGMYAAPDRPTKITTKLQDFFDTDEDPVSNADFDMKKIKKLNKRETK